MIRFFKSTSVYAGYIEHLYASRPGLADLVYAAQRQVLADDCFGWGDSWRHHLEAAGTFVVEDVIMNCRALQEAWARSRDIEARGDDWLEKILLAQLQEFRPDIWFVHGYSVGREFRNKVRSQVPSLKWIIAWDGIRRDDAAFFAGVDHVLACHPDSVTYYRNHGFASHFYRFGFERSICDRVTRNEPLYDTVFLGGITLRDEGHWERIDFLDSVSRRVHVDYWLTGDLASRQIARLAFGHLRRGQLRPSWEIARRLPALRRLREQSLGALFGLEMYQAMADSRIVLNSHIDAAGQLAGNMRMFEATGIGACLVTDWKENLQDLFVPGEEVVAYRNPAECIEKIRYLIANESERRRIARAGQHRTLTEHSAERSMTEFIKELIEVAPL